MWPANFASIGRPVKSLEMESMASKNSAGLGLRPEGDRHRRTLRRQGHNYRIVVSDSIRGRPIWFGGTDRSEKSMDLFFQGLGPRENASVASASRRDGTCGSRSATPHSRPATRLWAVILYDKFHILKHLNEALDKVRQERASTLRLSGKDRKVHQRPEVHIAVPPGQPDAGGASVVEGIVQGQPKVEQSVSAQGDVQSTVGLQTGGVGAAILRALEVGLEVATPEAVREVRANGRGTLGRDRVLLP